MLQAGHLTCESCGHHGPELTFGAGDTIVRELRRCMQCGAITSVLTLSLDPATGWWREHEGLGRCSGTAYGSDAHCGNAELVPYEGGPFGQVPVDACLECGGTRWFRSDHPGEGEDTVRDER